MTLTCFCIHDSKAEAFITPFFQPTQALALRLFSDAANDPSSMICKHSEDYTLFELGTFNSLSGMTTFHASPKSIALAATLKTSAIQGE